MFEDYIEVFKGYLVSKNSSTKTVEQYELHVRELITFLELRDIFKIEQIEIIDIDLFRNHLMKKNKPQTVRKKFSAIKQFFHYLESRGYLKKNPTNSLETIKVKDVDSKPRHTLNLKEASRLIDASEKISIPSLRLRNKSIILSYLFFGLRVDELINLKVSDLDFDSQNVYVTGKGGKQRIVPLNKDIASTLKEHIKSRPSKSEFVFTRKKSSEPLSQRAIYDMIEKTRKKARIKKQIGSHSLRRTSATLLYEDGVSMRKIQMFLGHSSITTTMIYLNLDSKEVNREISEKQSLGKILK